MFKIIVIYKKLNFNAKTNEVSEEICVFHISHDLNTGLAIEDKASAKRMQNTVYVFSKAGHLFDKDQHIILPHRIQEILIEEIK